MKSSPLNVRSRPILVLLFLILTLAPAARAGIGEWTSQGPYGGTSLSSLTIDPTTPSTLYVARSNTLYKSTDRGSTWVVHSTTFPTRGDEPSFLRIDPVDPSIFYLGLYKWLYRSVDGGVIWSFYSQPGNGSLVALEIDPLHPSTLYGLTDYEGVYKSTDGGATWSLINEGMAIPGLSGTCVSFLAISPSSPETLFAGYCGGPGYELYKSINGGLHWSPTGMREDLDAVEVDPVDAAHIYALGNGTLYKSIDGGSSWEALDLPVSLNHVVIDPSQPSILWAGVGISGLYRSADGGISWEPANQGLSTARVQELVIDPENSAKLYALASAGHPAGVYRSRDGGLTWSSANIGLLGQGGPLAVSPTDPSRLYAGTSMSGMFTSTNGGRTWQALVPSILRPEGPQPIYGVIALAVHPTDPLTVYAATYLGVLKSTDGGKHWSGPGGGILTLIRKLAIDPQNPSNIYGGALSLGDGISTLYKSSDAGESWQAIGDFNRQVHSIAIDPLSPSTLFISVGTQQVYKSTDSGESWRHIEIGPEFTSIAELAIDPRNTSSIYAASAMDSGIFKSIDGGESWFSVNDGLDHGSFLSLALDPANPSTLYASAATPDFGSGTAVYCSDDGGEHWTLLVTGLEGLDHTNLVTLRVGAPERSAVYGTTSNAGVWVYDRQTAPCTPGAQTLCVGDGGGRFEVSLRYDTVLGGGRDGDAGAIALDALGVSEGGILWFFDPTNPEVLVKVLDACLINDRYWVFYAATTTAGFTLNVLDRLSGVEKIYTNPDLTSAAPVADTDAFTGCHDGATATAPPAHSVRVPGGSVVMREAAKDGVAGSCVPGPDVLCIDGRPGDGRFRVTLHYDTVLGGGREGEAGTIPLTPAGITRGGILWFFERANPEVLVKVLDGCAENDHFWLFYAATTTAGFTLTVEDTATGAVLDFINPDQNAAVPISQIEAFAGCEL